MNKIKRISKDRIKLYVGQVKNLSLNGINYKGYMLGDLPPSYGYIRKIVQTDDGAVTDFGIKEWFNYKGLTYIKN